MASNGHVIAVVLVVVAVASTVTAGATTARTAGVDGPGVPSAGIPLDWDETVMTVDIRPDGTATVLVEYRYRLDDTDAEETFADVRQDVEQNPLNHTGQFAADMAAAARAAQRDTGREMTINNVTVNATRRRLPETYGVLVFTFEWEGFAAVTDDGRLRASGTLSGMTLDEQQALLVTWPSDYRLVDATPDPVDEREREVVWRGPVVFGESGPTVVVAPTGERASGGVPLGPGAAVVGVLALLIVGVVVQRRRRGAATDVADELSAADDGDETSPADVGDESVPADDGDQSTPDEDLLSDEERVLQLLEDQGGRMKQQDVVAAVDWSETKTSEVVQALRDADRVEVYRIGRENVLALPGEMDL